ncbi:MAG TPA: ABC transporter substrate-binding protein [Steroidobacteraceae bacterium]|nr:ABC transporter substrate-binding protein [Steroidobacteraceae bacterium]
MNVSASLRSSFLPTGQLRAAINLGNPLLAKKDAESGEPVGVSIDLARELAHRLKAELNLVVFDAAIKSVEAVMLEQADFGFFAIDPDRSTAIEFTAPYMLIEGCYLVREDSSIRSNEEVDRAGNRVAVGKGSAYDLFLSREIRNARIVRAPTSPTVVQTFTDQGLEVAAGVKQQLEADAGKIGGLRLLPQRFMVIQQAMGTPKRRGQAPAQYLRLFVEEMKSSGFVSNSLAKHEIVGASVAA